MNKQVELIDKAIGWFNAIVDDVNHITTGNLAHQAATAKGRAMRAAEFLEKHKNDSLPEEPVSEDFYAFEKEYLKKNEAEIISVFDRHAGLVDGAQWKEQQMQGKTIDSKVIARFPLASEPCYDDVEIYAKYTKGLEEGDKVKVIIIKDE